MSALFRTAWTISGSLVEPLELTQPDTELLVCLKAFYASVYIKWVLSEFHLVPMEVDENRPNQWVKKAKDFWTTHTSLRDLPSQMAGVEVFDALLLLEHRIPTFSETFPATDCYRAQSPLNFPQLLKDVPDQITVTDQGNGCSRVVEREEWLASLLNAMDLTPWDSAKNLYSSKLVSFTEKGGGAHFQCCIPSRCQRGTVHKPSDGQGGPSSWSTAFCPPGTIHRLAVSSNRAANLVLPVKGDVLWLFWEPTLHNLQWWGKYHTDHNLNHLAKDAVQCLEKLSILQQKRDTAIVIPPYTLCLSIHSVIGVHVHVPLWGYKWLKEYTVGLNWETKWIAGQGRHLVVDHARLAGHELYWTGLEPLKELLRLIPLHPEKRSLQKLVCDTENDLRQACGTMGIQYPPNHNNGGSGDWAAKLVEAEIWGGNTCDLR